MTRVKNRGVIRRLAYREIKNDRKMDLVVVISIILTCVLFTALFTIGGSIMNGMQEETMRQVGGRAMAGVKFVLPEDYEMIKADSKTRDVMYRRNVGFVADQCLKEVSAEVHFAGSIEMAEDLYSAPTAGKLPEERNEIAMSSIVLEKLGVPCELGTQVPLTIDIEGDTIQETFTLSGYWKGDRACPAQLCWVSESFADEVAPIPTQSFYTQEVPRYTGYYMVDLNFSNSFNIEGKTEQLLERIYGGAETTPLYGVNWAYGTSSIEPETAAVAAVLMLLFFGAGYLIIYNIFHINISANIRSYGLLKTIGTTKKQIKRMVRIRAFLYCAMGIPAGLIIGILFGRVMLSSVLLNLNIVSADYYSVSPKLLLMICLFSAAFTTLTVMISCRKPGRIAGSVSPIEALRYNETDISIKKKEKKTRRFTPLSAARSSMARSSKKTAVVVLSLSLSVIMLNTAVTAVKGMDMDKYLEGLIIGDIIISGQKGGEYFDRFTRISTNDIDYICGSDGIAEAEKIYFEPGSIEVSDTLHDRVEKFANDYGLKGSSEDISQVLNEGFFATDIYGIQPGLIDRMQTRRGKPDPEKFAEGKYAIVMTDCIMAAHPSDDALFFEPGDTVTIKSATTETTKSYEVLAVCELPNTLSTESYYPIGGQVMIPDSEYFTLTENRNAMKIMINAKDGCLEALEQRLTDYVNSPSSMMKLSSKQTYVKEYNDFIISIKLIGGFLSGILALIGILNFVNAVVTGMISRKRELAMMNAVGMTGRQLTSMLAWEGIHYAVFTAVCSLIGGTLVGQLLMNWIGNDWFFTFHFTIMPILISIPILVMLSAAVPAVCSRLICRDSIVERLREH